MTELRPPDVKPSDLAQSVVRVIIVLAVALWSWQRAQPPTLAQVIEAGFLSLALVYLAFSLVLLAWSCVIHVLEVSNPAHLHTRRSIGLLADFGALSGYTAIGAENAIIVYPFFLTVIMGYGYRFGLRYLYLAIVAAWIGFTLAFPHNPVLEDSSVLVLAYYLSLLVVPMYSALLLKLHREVSARLSVVNAARARFIANISHELRTPLHAIISATVLLTEESDAAATAGKTARTKLRMISEAADHLLTLVNRILDIAAADAGSLRVERSNTDLYRVLRSTIDICQANATAKGLAFHWYADPGVPRYCLSSAQHLQEILINTLGNAVKYTETGLVAVKVLALGIDAGPGAMHLSFEITDTGIGIDAARLADIFEPFALGAADAPLTHTGTGIGLTITKEYVAALGGTITLESRPAQGTQCRIELPLNLTDPPSAAPEPDDVLTCMLVSSRALTTSETHCFEQTGWRVLSTVEANLMTALSRATAPLVVLVDESCACAAARVAKVVRARDFEALLVCYASRGAALAKEMDLFNTRVAPACSADLRTLSVLLNCMTARAAHAVAAPVPALSVLVVDDNDINLRTARMALEHAGHGVQIASSGMQALQLLAQQRYDVMVLDMHMPEISGVDVLRHHQATNQRATPTILLTADITLETRETADACGATALLTKPISPQELRRAVSMHARHGDLTARALAAAPGFPHAPHAPPLLNRRFVAELIQDHRDLASLHETIRRFQAETLAILTRLRAAHTAHEHDRLYRELHKLKGCAAALGADELFAKVTAYERAEATSMGDSALDALDETLECTVTDLYRAARASSLASGDGSWPERGHPHVDSC